jgi:hypothetical protein
VGRAVKETPSRRAHDAASAAALWEVSEELTGRRLVDVLAPGPAVPADDR